MESWKSQWVAEGCSEGRDYQEKLQNKKKVQKFMNVYVCMYNIA